MPKDRFVVLSPSDPSDHSRMPDVYYVSDDPSPLIRNFDPRKIGELKDRIIREIEIDGLAQHPNHPKELYSQELAAIQAIAHLDETNPGGQYRTPFRDALQYVFLLGMRTQKALSKK